MKRRYLIPLLGLALSTTGGLALAANAAQSDTAAQPPQSLSTASHDAMSRMHGMHGMHGKRMMMHRMGLKAGPVRAVIANLREITRLYRMQGKTSQLEAVYRDVLKHTQNPMVRNYVYQALARVQLRPRDPDAAIAVLRKSLDENLTRLDSATNSGS